MATKRRFSTLINVIRDDKIEIFIKSQHSSTREFDINISEDGLRITIDGPLIVRPRAANQIEVDYP